MKFLVAGLGNIGPEYENTRHNVGFKVLDHWAAAKDVPFELQRHAFQCEVKHRGRTINLIKPTTFMNLSGKAVIYWLKKLKITKPEQLMVVVDDISLPYGTIRIRKKGSDGGHNGLKDINAVLGTSSYPRMRIGIGAEFNRGGQVDYVLGEWSDEELKQLDELCGKAVKALESFAAIGLDRTMNQFNG